MQVELFEINWSFAYPPNCTILKFRSQLREMASLWHGWESFPWYLTRTVHRQTDQPAADWDHLHTLAWMRSHSAWVLLNERFEDREAVLRMLIEHEVQFQGIFRHLVLDQIHWCLVFKKWDRLPDCALCGANTPEGNQALAAKRTGFREGVELAVEEFVRLINFASATQNVNQRIAGHPLRVWFKGAHFPDVASVPVRMDQSNGNGCLRPDEATSARFLSRRLPVPRIETRTDGTGGAGESDMDSELGDRQPAAVESDEETQRKIGFLVFNLAMRLDEGGRRKPPAHATVMRLYCQEGFTIRRIATECGCAEGTVINRKHELEKKLGMRLDALREYSGIFDEAQKTLEYAKAKSIHRRGLMG